MAMEAGGPYLNLLVLIHLSPSLLPVYAHALQRNFARYILCCRPEQVW